MKILFVTLSNIGDAVLTLPALDYLTSAFPAAEVTCLVGPRPRELFVSNPAVRSIVVYDKKSRLRDKVRLLARLRRERFDAIVDLRNSIFGFLLPCRYRIRRFLRFPPGLTHMSERHLYKAVSMRIPGSSLGPEGKAVAALRRSSLRPGPQDSEYVAGILKECGWPEARVIAVACGARSHTKRWQQDKFVAVCTELLSQQDTAVLLVGDAQDREIASYIASKCAGRIINLCGRTTILQLAALLRRAAFLLTNDSALLHIASYLNVPVAAVFGPTSDKKYGPWSDAAAVAKKEIFCRPCQKAQCRFGTLRCLELVSPQDVMRQIEGLKPGSRLQSPYEKVKRILVARTDRVGDVLLSTPAIKALRDAYPHAYIAMVVSPQAREVVEGNPCLDEVFVYDKNGKHRSPAGSFKFALRLRRERFDVAIILHPTNRMHLVAFLAGAKRRIGYARKLGFLLTERLPHAKHLGEKHESEYVLEMLGPLGIEAKDTGLYMPIKQESERWAKETLERAGIGEGEFLCLHPAASCPSKIWPQERFAEAADRLNERYGLKTVLIAGPRDIARAERVASLMRTPALNLAGKTSISQLASVLKRCRLFVSNDSGPVHVACAVGAPVISIFGRNQKGLSPLRWGPLGKKSRVLHKEVGCAVCLAHNCKKGFACLEAITVEDVLEAADSILEKG